MIRRVGRAVKFRLRSLQTPSQLAGAGKLHLGAGTRQMDGWANIDLGGPNIVWDLTRNLPVKPNSVDFVFTEHFIEHISRSDAQKLLRSMRRSLRPGGVIRISTPDLKSVCTAYMNDKLLTDGHWAPKTGCEMVNDIFHGWDHQFIYDEKELRTILVEAGFADVRRVARHQSDHPELRGLETRPDLGDLIVEAS